MSIEFAERIIEGMVDENGYCGERGMSTKQFDAIMPYLKGGEVRDAGDWMGDYSFRNFTEQDFEGDVGKYHVKLNEYWHFHRRCTVVEINLRPKDEYEFECWLKELGKFEHSEWVGEPKQRTDMELTFVREWSYERHTYRSNYYTEWFHIYTLADDEGNCYVWKTTNDLDVEWYDEDGKWHCDAAEPGDRVVLKATVKEHGEYKGIKQTVITRPKIKEVQKRVA